jgi:hypothetical protein
MTPQDQIIGALCAFREARGGAQPGMTSVLNVLANRAAKKGTDVYTEATARLQFSSMTVLGDPETIVFGRQANVADWQAWVTVLGLAQTMAEGNLADITNGSTLYFAPEGYKSKATFTLPDNTVIPFPDGWNASAVTYEVTIANQVFFSEQ